MAGYDRMAIYRGALFAVALQWAVRAVGLVSVVALARLLDPADFGLMAVALTAAAFVEQFGWIGLRQALLRVKDADRSHYDTAWTIQLCLFGSLTFVLLALAPIAAWFYQIPALTAVLCAISLRFICLAFVNTGIVDFERELAFGRDMKMRLSVRVAALVASLAAAVVLRNYWALVIGLLAQSVFYTIASYIAHPFRPRLDLSRRSELLGVSVWMLISSTALLVQQQIERLVLGRFAASAVVGLYSVSKDLSSIFTQEIATALNRVTFVTVAQSDKPSSPAGIGTMIGAYAAIVAPLAAGLVATAHDTIAVLLGEKWLPAAPLLQIIAIYTGVQAVFQMVSSVLQASGFARRAAMLNLWGAALSVGAIVAAAIAYRTPGAVAVAALAVNCTTLAAGVWLLTRGSGVGAVSISLHIVRPVLAAIVMIVAVQRAGSADTGIAIVDLLLSVVLGAATYAAALALIWLASGRPPGTEAEAALLVGRLRRRRAGIG